MSNLWTAVLFLFFAHIVTWLQLNGQFKWDLFKNNETWVVLLFAVPVA